MTRANLWRGMVLASALVLADGPAAAQVLERYSAYLSADDHYNSRGARLTQAWQIIRQDRANFHRYGIRDLGDQTDGFFASAENRARLESLIRSGRIDPAAARRIVEDEVFVHVTIYPDRVDVMVD